MEAAGINQDITETLIMLKSIRLSHIIAGITPNEYISLRIIQALINKSQGDGVHISQIGSELEISAPAVSKMLKGLEEKGLIRREVDFENRRNTFVFLTKKGIAIKANADNSLNAFFKNVYAKVGREDIGRFQMLAKKITAAVIEETKLVEERTGVYCEKKLC